MRAIAAEFFEGSHLMGWPALALVLFLAVFILCVVRLARRGAAPYDELARLPLEPTEESHEQR